MEPITLSISISVLIAGVILLVREKRRISNMNIREARHRARQRVIDRAFADTESLLDPYHAGLDFVQTSVGIDNFNQFGLPLSQDQVSTINKILESKTTLRDSDNQLNMATLNYIPTAEVKYLDPDFAWIE